MACGTPQAMPDVEPAPATGDRPRAAGLPAGLLGHEGGYLTGRLVDQPLREAGAWGVLRPGTSVNGLAPLFPRVEQA